MLYISVFTANLHEDALPSDVMSFFGFKGTDDCQLSLIMNAKTGKCNGNAFIFVTPDKQDHLIAAVARLVFML